MPEVIVEIGDDGKPVKVPGEVQRLIDAAFGQGRAKATDEAAVKLKDEIDKLKRGGDLSAVERERLKTLEADHSRTLEELARAKNDNVEADRIRTERHKQELAERDEKVKAKDAEVEKRTSRIRELLGKEIRAIATAEGARKESLDELELLLGHRIGLDDALQAFVKDAKDAGKAALEADGKTPVTVEGLVRQYLTDHPHHRSAASGRGGGGRGGRSGTGETGTTGEKAVALADLERNPSVSAVAAALRHAGKSA